VRRKTDFDEALVDFGFVSTFRTAGPTWWVIPPTPDLEADHVSTIALVGRAIFAIRIPWDDDATASPYF
jgi:hypothetical protein